MPKAVRTLYPGRLWRFSTRSPLLYLTFDDGPTQGVTDRVLEQLEAFNARATFFCTGRNTEWNPHLKERILEKGHGIGNHGFNHLNGRKYSSSHYLKDLHRASHVLPTPLFRPPYGRLKWSQARRIKKSWKIVMWDVLSGDFDPKLSPSTCRDRVIRYARPGSILLFHDSEKAMERVEPALPEVLEHFSEQGYRFPELPGSRFYCDGSEGAEPQ